MSTQTETCTTPPMTIRLEPPAFLEALADARRKFAGASDPCSLACHRFSDKMAAKGAGYTRTQLEQKVNKFVQNNFVNSYDGCTLENPMKLREYVVEPWFLQQIETHVGYWPGDMGDLKGAPHLHARTIHDIVQPYVTVPPTKPAFYFAPLAPGDTQSPEMLQMLPFLVQSKIIERQLLQMETAAQKSTKQQIKATEAANRANKEFLNKQLEALDARAKQKEDELKHSLDNMQKLSEVEQGVLKIKIEALKGDVAQLAAERDEFRKTLDALVDENNGLRAQIGAAQRRAQELAAEAQRRAAEEHRRRHAPPQMMGFSVRF